MYYLDPSRFQTILCYKDFYGTDEGKPNIIEVIPRLNIHKTISIICELIAFRNKSLDFRVFNGLLSVPLELGLKIKLLGLNENEYKTDSRCNKKLHVLSLQMLLNLLKYVFAYGDLNTLNDKNYEISFEDYKTIIDLQMVVTESYNGSYSNMTEEQKAHFIYANYHINSEKCVANAIIRNYYMFEKLALSVDNFDEDTKKEWRDYRSEFLKKYNYSILDYMAIMLYELITYFNDVKQLMYGSNWRNTDIIYGKTELSDISRIIIDNLSSSPEEVRGWAVETIGDSWDFSLFLKKPFVKFGDEHISVSDYTSSNGFTDNIYWLIRNCYPIEDDRCMAFYGRLYEKYIQKLTHEAAKNNTNVECVPEFICKSGNKSSDVYIKIGDCLIIVECKGYSVLIDTVTKGESIGKNNDKLFINPILQADERFAEIIADGERFTDIKQTYIISVTTDNVNAVPQYYEEIHREINKKKKSSMTKYVYNLSVEEYERLMYYVEENADIISILRDYFESETLLPFTTFLSMRYPDATDVKTKFMETMYKEFAEKVRHLF